MAFNLDKNDGATSSPKFDLSKSNEPVTAGTVREKGRSKTWLIVLPLVLVVGIAAWYFLSRSGGSDNNDIAGATAADTNSNTANVAVGEENKVTVPPADIAPEVKKENAGSSTNTSVNNSNVTATTANNSNNSSTVSSSGLSNKVPATFAQGSTSISNLDQSLVNDITSFLEKNPAAIITVNGYASSEGDRDFNQHISQARADAFKSYLVSRGINEGRIRAYGKGIDNPFSSNDTNEGRIKNRRVEILFQ